jgi:hypothetical protein
VTSPGEYAPGGRAASRCGWSAKRRCRRRKSVTYDQQLARGTEDSQFVEIAGIVRSVQLAGKSRSTIRSRSPPAAGGCRCTRGNLPGEADGGPDSTAPCGCAASAPRCSIIAASCSPSGFMVPRPEDLVIELPAPARSVCQRGDAPDRQSAAVCAAGSLWASRETGRHGDPLRAGHGRCLCRRANRAWRCRRGRTASRLQLGDRVEALGFVRAKANTRRCCRTRSTARSRRAPPPKRTASITPDEALKRHGMIARLVQVAAKLLDRALHGSERSLILPGRRNAIFHAYLKQPDGQEAFAGLENGSRILVTGVCRSSPANGGRANSGGREVVSRAVAVAADDVVCCRRRRGGR